MSQKLVHIGVAALLAAATVTAFGLVRSVNAAGSGTESVYVPIPPCRLADTRAGSDNVGTRSSPIGSGEIVTFAVWGTNGNCTVPVTATGIATNVTAVNPTAASYVTVYPADADPRPTASNLNVVAGGAPVPNQVTVALSAGGAISAYNHGGTLDLIIDIVGYFVPATSGGPAGPAGPPGVAGPPGPPGPGQIVNVRFFSRQAAPLTTTFSWQFLGIPTSFPNAPTQDYVASFMAPIGHATPLTVRLDVCHQRGVEPVVPFSGSNYSSVELSDRNISQSIAGTFSLSAGTVRIGPCIYSSEVMPIADFSFINGYIMTIDDA